MDPPENLPPPPSSSSTPVRSPAPRQGGPPAASGTPPPPPGGGGNGAGATSSQPGPSSSSGAPMRPPPPGQVGPGRPSGIVALAVPKFRQMKRNGHGSKGAQVNLECNHFKVKFQPRDDVYHYNVTIEPVTKKVVSRKVMAKLYDTYGQQFLMGKRFAYDGEKSLFTVGALDFNSHSFPVHLDDEPGWGGRRGNTSVAGGNSPGEEEEGRPSQRRRIGGRDFDVELKFAAKVHMGAIKAVLDGTDDDSAQRTAQDALRVLDIMLREHAAKRDFLLIRDSYFHKSLGPIGEIGEGVQSWRGFHVSFRPTSGGCLTLNFDLSTTTVIKPSPVILFIQEHCKKDIRQFKDADWSKVRRVLKGIQVETYAGRKMKIGGLSSKACQHLTFEKKIRDPSGEISEVTQEVTVADYFQKERNLSLRHPDLPALNLGRDNKPQYFPIEYYNMLEKFKVLIVPHGKFVTLTSDDGYHEQLCKIMEGQRYKRNLSGVQRKNHIDSARQPPEERKRICMNAMDTNNYNADELVKEFNVQIDRNMASVRGRVLEPPSLLFGNREEKPQNGRWNFNAKKMKLTKEIKTWAVANFSRFPAEPLAKQLVSVCSSKGMKLSNNPKIIDEVRSMQNRGAEERVKNMILNQMESLRPEFVLAILPEKSSDLYAPLKRICETGRWTRDLNPNAPKDPKDPNARFQVNIVSQCVVPPRNVKDQYLTNVALKINLKWGGYNTVLVHEEKKMLPKVSQVPTCIFGLDVSHGSPGDASSPSIAAVVASNNWPKFSTYVTRVRAQAPKTEMIEGLYDENGGKKGGMVMELLADFYKTCEGQGVAARKPQQFVIFRDGVSESQFDQVLEKELTAFKKAARALESSANSTYNPKVTFIVVQKRHHTRFFPTSGQGNVKAGTIVDRDVCHPRDNDFFLCSHAGPIGTTRPTHYHVLYDEIGFSADELQHLTHCLCYSYARCTSAVSVAAPAYYAHLAAQHCRNFVVGDGSGSESSSMTGRAGTFTALPSLNSKLLDKMFYT